MNSSACKKQLCVLALMVGCALSAMADDHLYYRIAGASNVALTALDRSGWLSWTGATLSATCQIESTTTLLPGDLWRSHVSAVATGAVTTWRVADPQPPAEMVFVPAGTYFMGDAFNEGGENELPVHPVFIDAFYMDRFEVTKARWDEVAGWAATNGYDINPSSASGKASDHPAYAVTWYEATKWCNARSEREGLTPCYTVNSQTYKTGTEPPVPLPTQRVLCNYSARGYRLPTEAEWEKAARGGLNGNRFPWGDAISHSNANYYASEEAYDYSNPKGYHPAYSNTPAPYTSPAGDFPANNYGLYDVAGNVWEWCGDYYSGIYYGYCLSNNVTANPMGPSNLVNRVQRGASCDPLVHGPRLAFRGNLPPASSAQNLGFRAVLQAGP